MADEQTRNALAEAAKLWTTTGLGAAIGVALKGFLSGTSGQEAAVRKTLTEENRRLKRHARLTEEWRYLCHQARLQAERLGYDSAKWPDEAEEEEDL